MTTIAYRDGVLAADSAVNSNGGIDFLADKIFRLEDGRLFASAGTLSIIHMVASWLNGKSDKPSLDNDDDMDGIIILPDGRVQSLDRHLYPMPAIGEFFACGSGARYAIGAMEAGATAEQAVEIACRRDCITRGPVNSVFLNVNIER